MINSNEKYQKLGVFKDTYKKVRKITNKNGMRISDYMKNIIDEKYKAEGFTENDILFD